MSCEIFINNRDMYCEILINNREMWEDTIFIIFKSIYLNRERSDKNIRKFIKESKKNFNKRATEIEALQKEINAFYEKQDESLSKLLKECKDLLNSMCNRENNSKLKNLEKYLAELTFNQLPFSEEYSLCSEEVMEEIALVKDKIAKLQTQA
jgi:hypothetical protein